MAKGSNPPALVFLGDYYGTLETARCLGKRGIDVTLADAKPLARTRGSRYLRRRIECPNVADVDAFIAWLEAFGRKEPGHVLFAASDELVWIFAKHRERLLPYFQLTSPDLPVTLTLLDKKKLHDACARARVPTPQTWYPKGAAEARKMAKDIPLPVLLKPRTQVQLKTGSKGGRVDVGADLAAKYVEYAEGNSFGEALVKDDAEVVWPMVQEFLEGATHDIYSLSGFADGDRFVVRASVKILQRPRKLGIGLCFQSASVEEALARALKDLCKQIGYRGVFEVEFVERKLLIDFNPRPYSQMAFESARGMPLPWLLYLLATGRDDELAREMEFAARWNEPGEHVYAHGFLLGLVNVGQLVSRSLTGRADEAWGKWARDHQRDKRLTDAVQERGDPFPAVLDIAEHVRNFVKHPRAFVRSLTR